MFSVTMKLVSCHDDAEHEYFLIAVDSISVPEIIQANQPFDVNFFGYVGSSGCYSFDRFIMDERNDTITVEVWGKYKRGTDSCPTAEVELGGKKLNCLVSRPGYHLFIIKNPDGSTVNHMINVQQPVSPKEF